jgi:Rha family phage regulatory protein
LNIEQKTITSVEVAEMVGKDHSNLLKDIRRYIDQSAEVKIDLGEFFTEHMYTDANKQFRPCYLVTKKGCEFIAHKMTGVKGTEFTAKYINRFHDMEEVITTTIQKLSDKEIMRLQLTMIDDVTERVEKLENNMTIDYGQQQVIKEKVNVTVIRHLGGKTSNAYKEMSKVVFSECNKDIQHYFNVNSRNNLPKIKFDDAIKFIESWEPAYLTKINIQDTNNQVNISDIA